MVYCVIYDGQCNLCVTFTQVLETFDQGNLFQYVPMQDEQTLKQFGITAEDCQMGIILIDSQHPDSRWQGSAAAEEIVRLLPMGALFLTAYRSLPGMKLLGDATYEQVRDHRYEWFGKRNAIYQSSYPMGCANQKD
ncbi:thiol-disulfide oxidoreductase DCC family protein [Chroococcus sp. FPU101]|uniref:thiol-disulfide oxidoreductase DCC family protein n=1 Tax=Chroococcus sp. FPU101 TaxID=1974212 RepID=UPI001A8F6DE0|nr:DCC1-like thiol-disulfide oxidoreductase family protein [Chroococcus sp. FPU101]GFE68237.1 putative thiol-disulphide oxidoreductase DCC [Chroococcus sp. FPU101]